MLEVIALSILQGVAEFLPISSSGHLALGKQFLGMEAAGLRLDIFLHLGTLLAVLAFYAAVIRRIVMTCDWRYVLKIVVSAVPVGIVGVLFKDRLEVLGDSSAFVGGALIFTGIVLLATRMLQQGKGEISWMRAVWMGLAQALAILPGVSRSGMTLVAARCAKVDAAKSAEFSFLMSAPPIAGAALLEAVKSIHGGASEGASAEVSWGLCLMGAMIAAGVGYLALKALLTSLKSDKFWLFGPYCIVVGAIALMWR